MVDSPFIFNPLNTAPPTVLLRSLGTRLALYQHHRDPMAWEQLFDASRAWALSAAQTLASFISPDGSRFA